MTLKNDDTYIGTLSFKGPAQDNVVEIEYGVLPDQEGKGYTTEAVQAMTQWAFGNADVVFVEAETEPENRASQRILEKYGFVSNGEGQEGPRFVLELVLELHLIPRLKKNAKNFGSNEETASGNNIGGEGV